MSQNILQIFNANPASSMISTDLIYLGRSPYGTLDDFAITFANFATSVVASAGAVLLAPSGDQTITGAHNLIMATGSMVAPTMLPGNLSLTGNTISSTSGNINLIPNGAGFFNVGTTTTLNSGLMTLAENSLAASLSIGAFINNASGPTLYFNKSRNTTVGSNTAVQSNDVLMNLSAYASDGAAFQQSVSFVAQAAGTISSGIVPGVLTISTANSSGVLTQALTIDQNQLVTAASLQSVTTVVAQTGLVSGLATGGNAGLLDLYSPTASKGLLQWSAANNAANYTIAFVNASFGQSTTITVPDPGASTSTMPLNTGSLTSGHLVSYNGTAGLLQDSGIAIPSAITPWTPVASFGTVGDLTVSYAVQSGNYVRNGHLITATFQLTFTPTYTTSSGDFIITGLPVTPENNSYGTLSISNITLTTLYTNLVPNAQSDGNIYFYQSGSAQTRASLTVTQLTSGSAYSLYGTITYMV